MTAKPARLEAFALSCNSANWACMGKDSFDTQAMAQKVIGRMLRHRGKRQPGVMRAYRCPYCAGWHIGGQS